MNERPPRSTLVIIVLLSGIVLALMVIIAVSVSTGRTSQDKDSPVVRAGERVDRGQLSDPTAKPASPIADPDRIRETLQAGKTYHAVLKAGVTARVEDQDWGVKSVTNLTYIGEMEISRKIESNDGQRIVELRRFEVCRSAKLLCEVEAVTIELGPSGYLLLGALDYAAPGAGSTAIAARPLAETILGVAAQRLADDRQVKALGQVDSFAGKTLRITYVDGVGVESLTPVDCTLTAAERDFALRTAVVSDCYLFPDVRVKPGASWQVDAGQLIGFLDPSLRGVPQGTVTVVRESASTEQQEHAVLRIDSGLIRIDQSDQKQHRVGTFKPRGTLNYSLTQGFIETAKLEGEITFERLSKDHLLFPASFRTQPQMEIDYFCRIRP